MIEIDVVNRKLNLLLSDKEIKKRLENWKPPKPKVDKGYLNLYRKVVNSAKYGAYLN